MLEEAPWSTKSSFPLMLYVLNMRVDYRIHRYFSLKWQSWFKNYNRKTFKLLIKLIMLLSNNFIWQNVWQINQLMSIQWESKLKIKTFINFMFYQLEWMKKLSFDDDYKTMATISWRSRLKLFLLFCFVFNNQHFCKQNIKLWL